MSQSAASQKLFNPRAALAGAALLAAFGLAGCSGMGMGMGGSSTPSAVKVTNGTLTDQHGMALYTFDRDAMAGKSACNGKCAENWPPLAANDADKPSGDYTIITRDDGKKQWAYRGKPLYLWTKDKMPGDQTGDGFMNVWHIAKP
ncbi:COG4315 family predicted lipoprotein [Ralstonia sp. L16]|uniref:COG4315 family predicted lipoprotein n=1 Tax=Ralstonia TaxID=48736 RepID=UPI001E64238A|nr:ATP-binding protein [Ralstonia wenshanensis]MDY7510958.1 ATP-binding protein [Ralstonia wenshanensis]UGS90546.1 ATP-binding protein [Ralstonia wenshanensis]